MITAVLAFEARACATGLTLLSGPLLLGYMFSSGLYGVLCLQAFMYHVTFPNDSRWMKAYVLLVFTIETAMMIITTYSAWFILGSGFGDINRILMFDPTTVAQPALTALTTLLYHAFYCWRILKMTHNKIVPVVAGMMSTLQFALAMYIAVNFERHQRDPQSNIQDLKITGIIMAWLLTAAVTDVIITYTMVTLLVKYRQNTVYQATISNVQKIIKFTVETGLLTSCSATIEAVLYLTDRNTFWYFTLFYTVGKIYSNTLMASLNSRMIFSMNTGAITDSNNLIWSDLSTFSVQKSQLPPVDLPSARVHVVTDIECTIDDSSRHGIRPSIRKTLEL